jgi:addiction module HigA family antidote
MVGDIIGEMGLSIVDAARGLGVTRQQLHNLIAGCSAVSPEMAYRLEKALGSTADAWLRLQANYDLAQAGCAWAVTSAKRACALQPTF